MSNNINNNSEEIFRDPLSGILFHTKLSLPSIKSKYHLCGTGTYGFFTVGFYSVPNDLHESINRHLNFTSLYNKPSELNARIDQIQRVLVTSQRPAFFLMHLTQDVEYSEFVTFFEVQLLAQHRALSQSSSSSGNPTTNNNNFDQYNANLNGSSSNSLALNENNNDNSTQTAQNTTPPQSNPPSSPQTTRRIQSTVLTQEVHQDLRLLLSSFPRRNYKKGNRLLFFQGETHLRIETDCIPDPASLSINATAHPPHYNDNNHDSRRQSHGGKQIQSTQQQQQQPLQVPFVPVPIPSDNILCQHLRSIFLINGVYPFDNTIDQLYSRTPNHIPQPSLQRLPIVLIESLMTTRSIVTEQESGKRNSFSLTQSQSRLSNTWGSTMNNNNDGMNGNLNYSNNNDTLNSFATSSHIDNNSYNDDSTSSSSSSSSSSDEDDDDDENFNQNNNNNQVQPNDFRLSYEAQRERHQLAMSKSHIKSLSGNGNGDFDDKNGTDLVAEMIEGTVVDSTQLTNLNNISSSQPHSRSTSPIHSSISNGVELSSDSSDDDDDDDDDMELGAPKIVVPFDTINTHSFQNFPATPSSPTAPTAPISQFSNPNINPTIQNALQTNPSQLPIVPPLELPLIKPDFVLRSSYVYLEKANLFGFPKWKRRYLSLKGQTLQCSHHHLLEPTISVNLQTCKLYVDQEHIIVDYDALPILNSPNSYIHSSLKLTQSTANDVAAEQPTLQQIQQYDIDLLSAQHAADNGETALNASLTETSITHFFSSLINKNNNNTDMNRQNGVINERIGSHLTRVPKHLCMRDSFHVIFVIVDDSSGYQLRISADPHLAKKWLRDLIVVATLARMQNVLQREVAFNAKNNQNNGKDKQTPSCPSWERHYYRLIPSLAHYKRDSSLLIGYIPPPTKKDNTNGNNNTIPKRAIGEVLPDTTLLALQRKQQEYMALTMKMTTLAKEAVEQDFQNVQSAMYSYEEKVPKSTKNTNYIHQPTIHDPVTPAKRNNRQAAASGKGFFETLQNKKANDDATSGNSLSNSNDKSLSGQKSNAVTPVIPPPPQYLVSDATKLTKLEIVMGLIIFIMSIAYLYHRTTGASILDKLGL